LTWILWGPKLVWHGLKCCNQKGGCTTYIIEHPSKTQILTELKFLRSRNWIATLIFSLSQTLFKTQSVCTLRSSNMHNLHSWSIHHSNQGIQNLNFIHRMYRQLRHILPAFLTDPSSSCKTISIFLWFLISLRYSLILCFLMPIVSTWLATGTAEKVCNRSNLVPKTNRSTPQSTPFCVRLAQSAFPLQQHGLPKNLLLPLQLSLSHHHHLLLCNLSPGLWVTSSSAAMRFPPPQVIIATPPQTVIVRRLPYARWSSLVLQKQQPCISAVNESNAQPNQWWLQKSELEAV
jgi:hypothetical protein